MNWPPPTSISSRLETKIFYYVDDDDKPFLAKVAIPLEQVTLGDFKRMLPSNRTNCKFFFRSKDAELGEIKEEVWDDGARVPSYQGRIVCYMVSLDSSVRSDPNSQGSGSTTKSSRALLPLSKTSSDGYSHNWRNAEHFDTMGKERNRAHKVPYLSQRSCTNGGYENESVISFDNRSSYSDSEFDGSSRVSSIVSQSAVGASNARAMRKRRRKTRPLGAPSGMNRASSMSSITETYPGDLAGDHIIRVQLNVEVGRFLGIKIIGPTPDNPMEGIFVDSVIRGSAVDADRRIHPGDCILQVNGISFAGVSHDEAISVLRDATSRAGNIILVVSKSSTQSSPPFSSYTMQEAYEENPCRFEPSQPIDPSAWVAHIEAMRLQTPEQLASTPMLGPRKSSEDPLGRPSGFFGNPLSQSPPVLSAQGSEQAEVVRQMARRDSGLDIRDRMWLKIPIPNAFMGRDLVTWLTEHMKDLKSRHEAKKYASSLLKNGYIRHTVGTKDFSEKSYYTFSELPHFTEDLMGMSLMPEEDFNETESQLAAYNELPDSVSQVGMSRVPYRPSSHVNAFAGAPAPFSVLPQFAGSGGPSRSHSGGNGKPGSGHSSGGSGYGSDRRQKSTIYEETDSQVTAVYNSIQAETSRGGTTGTLRGGFDRYYPDAAGKK